MADEDPEIEEEGAVLSPDELDIRGGEDVVEIEEGRYVISPSGGPPMVSNEPRDDPSEADGSDAGEASPPELTEDVVHGFLDDRLAAADSMYAFDVTGRFEDRTSQRSLFSNDVVTTFESLVVWYANHAASDTPVEDVVGILLMESNLDVTFPVASLRVFASAHGLEGSDTLEALFSAAREAGGVRFPTGDD